MTLPLPEKRRHPNVQSFVVTHNDMPEPCSVCGLPMKIGQKVRYSRHRIGAHHVLHATREQDDVICQTCFLAKPCGCED